jgi:hypothetical protein
MAKFTFSYTFADDSFLEEQENGNYKYWEGEGLPNYDGPLEGFAEMYPSQMQHLVDRKIFKAT